MSEVYLKRANPKAPVARRELEETVRRILDDVAERGEAAVRHYSRLYDQWDPPSFRVSEEEVAKARLAIPESLVADIHFAQAQVRDFARRQLDSMRSFEAETLPGVVLGQRLIPVGAVGAYVPGGRYSLIASAFMSILTPKVAGVERVYAAAPPKAGEGIFPATLYAIASSGADQIFCVGGVQALAGMAFGALADIGPVDMLVGPGNAYVAEAKRQLFGRVGIDLLAGPTEILIVADETADPHVVAMDLIGQAEHDPNSPAVLVTTSEALAAAVLEEVERLLPDVPTREVAEVAWRENGVVVVVSSQEEAAQVADRYAPEHLEVQARDLDFYLQRLRNYGSLFLGEEATVAYSDKAIGTNHILPTGGAARYTGGLWVGKFLKAVTYQRLTRAGSLAVAPAAGRVAAAEGMLAHTMTCELRLARYRGGETT
jgi:sulfopropanediol 3-dehydrogenase